MSRVTEFTPLLVSNKDVRHASRRRRNVWKFVLVGALSLSALSLFQQQLRLPISPPLITNVAVNLAAERVDDAAFLSSMETFKDPSVDPCNDFYQYACGGWLSNHEIPSDRPSIDSSFYVVSETNKDTLQKIFAQKPPQVNELFESCLDSHEVDTDAITFVAQLIENVHLANSTLELMEYAGEVDQSLGVSSFFSLSVGADPQDPSTNVLQLMQGGLTLPSREYYLENNKVDTYATLYVDYVTKLFAVGGLDKHNVSAYAQAVLQTETEFAKISLPNAALRNPWTTNTVYPFADIAVRYPFLMAYLNGIYKQEPFPMLHAIVATPDFFEAQNELLKDESLLPQLKNYLSFHLIDSFGAILGEHFRRASHEFHGKIQGAGDLLPRDQFCVRLTTAFLGDEIGEYYMKDVFGPDAKAAAQALVAEIEESLKALLTTEAWLDKVTYEAAVAKLDKVKNYIGGPDEVPALPFTLQSGAFFNNVKSLMQLSAAGTIQAINQPVNEQAWDMFPSTVNAYYDPSANKMVFPAAILQPPFYSAEHFPAAANFARIGMVMGHELSHGFDDQGRNYDENGALRSWWTPSVSAEFAEKVQCLSAQYSTFPVVSIDDAHVLGTVNGNLTLGENIADNGGIHLAYEAYQLWKSTFMTPPIVPSTEVPLPETSSPPAETPPEPAGPTPAPVPVETAPTPEPTETIPATVSIHEPSEPKPDEDIPAVTPAPVAPIPDEPLPEPTEAGPDEQNPETLPPPPFIPVPDAETPEPAQAGPIGEIPIATPSPVPGVPEPQPTDIGPGEVIPEKTSSPPQEQTPTPTDAQPPTEIPATNPTEVPNPATPEASPEKHKHKNKKEEPDEKEPSEKAKHHDGESEKDKKSDEPKPKDEKSHKRSTEKHGGKEEKKSHEGDKRGDDDEEDKSAKHSNKHGRDEEDGKHGKHHDDAASKHDDKKPHKGKSEGHAKNEHGHENDDGDIDESGEKHHHKKREENEKEDDNDRHEGKHHERQAYEEDRGHHGKHGHSDEDDNKHERKEERRQEHKERERVEEESGRHGHSKREGKEERREERKEERREEHQEHRKEEKEHKEERRKERKERRKEQEEECDGCDRKKHERHIRHHHGCGERESDCGSKRHKWSLSDNNYPFSGGDARIHSMVEKLARAIAQPDDSDDRLFFTAFAQNWCEKRTPGYAELLRMIDPHSPGKWRVNGPLMNYNKFAEAFSCPVGTPMNPEKKCVIW